MNGNRQHILQELEGLWHRMPELRFFKLLDYVVSFTRWEMQDPFYMPDTELLKAIQKAHLDLDAKNMKK